MEPWTTLRREPVFTHSKWVRVENHAIALPTGRTIERWPWIICPDYVNVAVIDTEGMLLCFRQTKYAVEGVALAPCGGYLEPNEDPLEAARRELREEMGY